MWRTNAIGGICSNCAVMAYPRPSYARSRPLRTRALCVSLPHHTHAYTRRANAHCTWFGSVCAVQRCLHRCVYVQVYACVRVCVYVRAWNSCLHTELLGLRAPEEGPRFAQRAVKRPAGLHVLVMKNFAGTLAVV
jgi:hypothetical protein